ncbi:MAG: AraC family transcriptional regulator [Pseudomonadota bacterium]
MGAKSNPPNVSAVRLETPAGGGAFEMARLSIGVFLVDQPSHQIALGSDQRLARPLSAQEGWILPAGAQGLCEYDAAHAFALVEIDHALLEEAGFDPRRPFAPHIGAHDPLLLQMALAAAAPQAETSRLYRETMRQALAAQAVMVTQRLSAAAAPRAPEIEDPRLRRALAYIEEHLASDLSLEAIAGEAAMSPFHFSRAFKAATGRSPLQYVIAERMDWARTLLRTTRAPVAEIAYRVGYHDASRFARHFKRAYGATPASVRD